jgi:hypothetical protein
MKGYGLKMQTLGNRTWAGAALIPLIIVQVWAARAIAFFAHEYAHAIVAWLLGWKDNPLNIDYAKPSITVFLIQLGINQKVDVDPIFAAGHGVDVAMIAIAGALLGNGIISYPLSRLGYRQATKHNRRGWAMFAFWITAASIGNFIDYVPIRTFTGGLGDMGQLEIGLGWSPWVVLVVLGIPTLAATLYFFLRIVPTTVYWVFPHSPHARYGVAVLSVLFVFGFYGAAGLLEGGPVSYNLSLASVFIVLPLVAGVEVVLLRRGAGWRSAA